MPSFRSAEALAVALHDAGLGSWVDRIVATVRPSILFRRHQLPDAGLPLAASKIGGTPTLPPGFAWPHRPAHPHAARKADAHRAVGARVRALLAATRAERMGRPPQPGERTIEAAELDALTARYDFVAGSFDRPFPLAFVAQLDLATLAGQAGFDPHLPGTGLLSVFADATPYGSAVRLFWSDEPGIPQEQPAELLAYYDTEHAAMTGPWAELTQAEALLPFSAVDIPDHWRAERPIAAWLEEVGQYRPTETSDGGNQANFGDRLGGWPANIQGSPEEELDPASRIQRPGETPWRHVFSWGGEYWGDTRLIPIQEVCDGNAYVMVHEDDLAVGFLDDARLVVQFT